MKRDAAELAELQFAMLRAHAEGFERTAAAMERVLNEMLQPLDQAASAEQAVAAPEVELQ